MCFLLSIFWFSGFFSPYASLSLQDLHLFLVPATEQLFTIILKCVWLRIKANWHPNCHACVIPSFGVFACASQSEREREREKKHIYTVRKPLLDIPMQGHCAPSRARHWFWLTASYKLPGRYLSSAQGNLRHSVNPRLLECSETFQIHPRVNQMCLKYVVVHRFISVLTRIYAY